ncbi:hypothetical protein PPROV_000497200 [Pycnococcus provasolii]|uniref:Uncharacterized protein n=1 Tax=Pycnococcus provasolii TaxID=41880 RepID=A0A830HH92_9CHLO|nr:hypothetical protein PPROV_000497200 [Pycnococcus provasolii]
MCGEGNSELCEPGVTVQDEEADLLDAVVACAPDSCMSSRSAPAAGLPGHHLEEVQLDAPALVARTAPPQVRPTSGIFGGISGGGGVSASAAAAWATCRAQNAASNPRSLNTKFSASMRFLRVAYPEPPPLAAAGEEEEEEENAELVHPEPPPLAAAGEEEEDKEENAELVHPEPPPLAAAGEEEDKEENAELVHPEPPPLAAAEASSHEQE